MWVHEHFSKKAIIPSPAATHPTPASAPAIIPHKIVVLGSAKNMARFADMTSAKMNDPPKARALLKPATCSSLNPFTRIQTLPNNIGEYQRPPMRNVERAAAKTASQLI